MSFDESNFEKLRFDPFGFDNVLLNNTNDPDKNIFNNLSQIDSVFYAVEEAATGLKKFDDKTFSVLHLNVRSLNKNFESLKELLTTIKFEFKVICLTQTLCTDDPRNETLFNLENYTSINQVRKHGRGGGICVFIHNSLTFKLRSDLGANSNEIESLVIEIINKNIKTVVINEQYRQPAGDFKQYKTYLANYFNKMKNSNKAIYIVGDTNLNLIDYDTNIKVKNYLNLLFQKNFIPVINKPTRVSRNNATIIDHIKTNNFLNNYMHSGIITADFSDHFPIFLISKDLMLDSSNEPIHITKREINDRSIAYFKTFLTIFDWKHVLNENSPNNPYSEFLRIFFGLYNEAFPKQKIKIKRKSFISPWLTKGLVKSSKKKQRLYEKCLKNRSPEKELNYKQYKTLFESLKKKSKKYNYSDLIDSHKYNIKKT